jgi:cobalt-zinc-cadmium efflux system outer membrane protein
VSLSLWRWLLARKFSLGCLLCFLWAGGTLAPVRAEPAQAPSAPVVEAAREADTAEEAEAEPAPEGWTIDDAVAWALENNLDLQVIRKQHGIAEAAVVIAFTYPFNPVWEAKIRAASGPASAGITNVVSNEHKVFVDVEVMHQGRYRREGAEAALSRTDYEIAFQEVGVAVRVMRAFDTVLYRQEKLGIVERTLKLNREVYENVAKLVELNQLRPADRIIARTEMDDTRAQLPPAQLALVSAQSDFRRTLGVVEAPAKLRGSFQLQPPPLDAKEVMASALERRPDLRARLAAVDEAEARIRLARADRFGNPNLGPAFEYDPTRVSLIGLQFTLPLPVFNRHRGEIMQREAERGLALAVLRQTEFQIRQDVDAALGRLKAAQQWADSYTETVNNLNTALKEMDDLFLRNQPGADILRVIDIRRKLLKAQEGKLDALWELSQALGDLAAAVGDPQRILRPAAPR